MDSIAQMKPSVLVLLTNPYLLNSISDLDKFKAVIMAYEYMPSLLRASAAAIIGINKVDGKLPISTKLFPAGSGLAQEPVSPAKLNMAQAEFYKKKFGAIDSIALWGIQEKAYPGCQIVAMKDGQVIYQKSFGKFTYNSDSKDVDNGTIYDLASLTKICSSALAMMKLNGEGKLDYTLYLGDLLPSTVGTNKEKIKIEDLLTHQAGLEAWILSI